MGSGKWAARTSRIRTMAATSPAATRAAVHWGGFLDRYKLVQRGTFNSCHVGKHKGRRREGLQRRGAVQLFRELEIRQDGGNPGGGARAGLRRQVGDRWPCFGRATGPTFPARGW